MLVRVCISVQTDVKSMDSSRPVIRSSEPSGPPDILQEKEKFKQESKTPVAPKKVQVSLSSCINIGSICLFIFDFMIITFFCFLSGCEIEEHGLLGQLGSEIHIHALICSKII